MPKNVKRSAIQLYRKIGQEPFVLAVGTVDARVRACVHVCVKGYKLHDYDLRQKIRTSV